MTEKSMLWTTGAGGDGASPYTQQEWYDFLRRMFASDDAASQGVLGFYLNKLAAAEQAANTVRVGTGGAIVYGFPYLNTAAVDVTVPTPAGATRVDLIVLRASWAAKEVRITRVAGTEGLGAPSLTQTPGTTWDVPICQVSITTAGVMTLTDQRGFLYFGTLVKTAMLDLLSVTTAVINDLAVTTAKLANDAVTTAKIADHNVTYVKLPQMAGPGVVGQPNSGSADLQSIGASTNDRLLARTSDVLSFVQVTAGMIPDSLITAAKIANRTRRFMVPPLLHTVGSTPSNIGADLQADQQHWVLGSFQVPVDFVSGMTVKPIFQCSTALGGNIRFQHTIKYGAVGEAATTHNADSNETLTPTGVLQAGAAASLASAAAGDHVWISTLRNGTDAADTSAQTAYFQGWLVEYTADS